MSELHGTWLPPGINPQQYAVFICPKSHILRCWERACNFIFQSKDRGKLCYGMTLIHTGMVFFIAVHDASAQP